MTETPVRTKRETDPAGVPSSRTKPGLVDRVEPLGHINGLAVYGWGQAPPNLRTRTQLGQGRLKLPETRDYGDVRLYDPADAVKMKPLPASTKAKMRERRTCPECRKIRDCIVHDRCGVCREKAERDRRRRQARTCWSCGEVFPRPLPTVHRRCQGCRRKQLARLRELAAAWVERVTH